MTTNSFQLNILPEEICGEFNHQAFEISIFRALWIYIVATSILAPKTKELAIHSAYGTNSTGMDSIAVISELDGTGIPLAYLFVESIGIVEHIVSGNMT